ncbi:polysaccharide deacetylase family protein [Candidatus Bathyarchaeota archaeon]|nr:polysaccharide deacetylase family protein [Candidatus Bathyarchaeota archaeon]
MPRADPVIFSPAAKQEFEMAADEFKLNVSHDTKLLSLHVTPDTTVSAKTEVHEFAGPQMEPVLKIGKTTLLSRIKGTTTHLLGIDILNTYRNLLFEGLEPNPSRRFKIVSRLPLSYKLVPSFIRNRTFRSPDGLSELTEDNLGPIEFFRTLFLASLVSISGPIPRIGFWRRGKTYALAVTHDVETEIGLNQGAPKMLETEQALGIRSTWNIPSERYPLKNEAVSRLARNGEVGTHDTKHDGRLVLTNERSMVSRLSSCKKQLEKLSGQKVRGFRAPLLQHSRPMLRALGTAGYEFDSSCPSWEMLSPTSFRPHGVRTVFPFYAENLLEIPVSLPQDHQLIRVAGQSPVEASDLIVKISSWIRGIGGACVLLTHPDYEFAMEENRDAYSKILETFRSDPACDIMTLGEMADWWRRRDSAEIRVDDGNVTVSSLDGKSPTANLQPELVTGYGEDGFKVVSLY